MRKGFDDLKEDHASNSWMVHGNLIENAKPIFSNDPHLTFSLIKYLHFK